MSLLLLLLPLRSLELDLPLFSLLEQHPAARRAAAGSAHQRTSRAVWILYKLLLVLLRAQVTSRPIWTANAMKLVSKALKNIGKNDSAVACGPPRLGVFMLLVLELRIASLVDGIELLVRHYLPCGM